MKGLKIFLMSGFSGYSEPFRLLLLEMLYLNKPIYIFESAKTQKFFLRDDSCQQVVPLTPSILDLSCMIDLKSVLSYVSFTQDFQTFKHAKIEPHNVYKRISDLSLSSPTISPIMENTIYYVL